MKKFCFLFIVVFLVTAALVGCNKQIKDGAYYLYSYDGVSGDFVKSNVYVDFSDNMSGFKLSIADAYAVYGKVNKNVSGYHLKVSEKVSEEILGIDDIKKNNPEAYKQIEEYISAFSFDQTLFVSGKRLFSSSDVYMVKTADSQNLSSVEGEYEIMNNDSLRYKFQNGLVYSIDIDDKGKATQRESASARYVLNDGIITVIRIDQNGKDVVYEGKTQKISYLFAGIDYPAEYADVELSDDAYSKAIKDDLQKIAGKTIAVMASAFYAKV